MSKEGSTSISAKVLTWPSNPHGLFDYASKDVHKSILKFKGSSYLARCEGSVEAYSRVEKCKSLIGRIKHTGSSLGIYPPSLCSTSNYENLWLVVKSLKPNGYKVAEGDVIRLGREPFRVKEIAVEKYEGQDFSLMQMLDVSEDSQEGSESFSVACRVCLSECFSPENPLISACKCSGSVKYTHLKCLQHSIRSKLQAHSTDYAISFSWKGLCCELCKKPYPYKLLVDGKVKELIQIPKPPSPYIILESLSPDTREPTGLHLISFCSKKEVVLGRGHTSDLQLTDISVSRNHAWVKFKPEGIFIKDNNSKFGTVVEIRRPVALDENFPILIQAENSLIELKVSRSWSLVKKCFSTSDKATSPCSPSLPVLPVNTGIPLSVQDQKSARKQPTQVPVSHCDLVSGLQEIEEVEVAKANEEIIHCN